MTSAKRILMLTHEFPPCHGAVGEYCWNLAGAAARAGHHVTVLAPAHPSCRSDRYRDPPGVKVVHFTGDMFQFRELPAIEQLVTDTVESGEWDVVHAAHWPMIAASRHLKQTYGRRVASLHGNDVLLFRHSLRARLVGAGRALRRFDSLVCNSAYTASLLRSGFPDVANVRVAPLGLEPQWFEEPSIGAMASYRARIAWSEEDRIVLTVARLDESKGHLATLAALSRLPVSERNSIKYVCAGPSDDKAYEARLVATAASLGVPTVLTGTLSQAELAAAYRTSSVLALCGQMTPQKVKGFGRVLLEAAAQGLPAVVTNVHALPELVVNGFTGWVCEGDEASRLATAMTMALAGSTSPEMREACVLHARQFTWERCAELTYDGRRAVAA